LGEGSVLGIVLDQEYDKQEEAATRLALNKEFCRRIHQIYLDCESAQKSPLCLPAVSS